MPYEYKQAPIATPGPGIPADGQLYTEEEMAKLDAPSIDINMLNNACDGGWRWLKLIDRWGQGLFERKADRLQGHCTDSDCRRTHAERDEYGRRLERCDREELHLANLMGLDPDEMEGRPLSFRVSKLRERAKALAAADARLDALLERGGPHGD